MGARFARARKIFATARMLAFSFKGARLFEISLVLLCSYFLYINDSYDMVKTNSDNVSIRTQLFSTLLGLT